MYNMIMNATLLLLCLLLTLLPSFAFSVDSINYKWNASIDAYSGLASSLETSSKKLEHDATTCTCTKRIQEIFSDYPKFLGQKNVSLGMLSTRILRTKDDYSIRDVKESSDVTATGTRSRSSICVSLPFFNITLLQFGDSKTIITNSKAEGTSVKSFIPIAGGLLSCHCNNHRTQNLGQLQFEYFLPHNECEERNATLQTRIVDYKPKIAGCSSSMTPLNSLRQTLYLGVQRPIHAYVMWRFHKHCHSLMNK